MDQIPMFGYTLIIFFSLFLVITNGGMSFHLFTPFFNLTQTQHL